VPEHQRDPDNTTTYGLGETIKDALDQGCSSIIIGIGGSATNDGGLGMLIALGMKAWDDNGNQVEGFGKDLHRIRDISFDDVDHRVQNLKINVACDVDNPLCGHRGASVVFGPQKGASPNQVEQYDKALNNFGSLVEKEFNASFKHVPGVGAAGGLGFGLYALGAQLVSGAELLANAMHLQDSIRNADLVFTGEGKSDEQTLYGKAPSYVAYLAEKYNVPVVLLSGSLDGDLDKLRSKFSGCFSIVNKPMTLNECMENAASLLYEQTKQIMHYTTSMR
jgi:glycerate kinase